MENNQKPALEQPIPKLSDRIDTNVKIIIAFFLGAILAGILVQFALPILAAHASELMIGFIAVIGLFAIIALIFTIFKEFFFKLFFGISKADLEDVKTSAESMAGNAVKQDWIAASKDFKVVSQKGSAWYAWLSYRRWVVTVFYTLFLAFAGLLGSVLLYNQNELLEKQNEKLDTQNLKIDSQIQLEESSRRGNLIVMMSNIMDKVDEELTNDWNNDGLRNLSPQLISRISALSHSFHPYRFWQDSLLIKKPLSPERGQFFLALVNSNLDSVTYTNIYTSSTFVQADLRDLNLPNVNFNNTPLIKYSLLINSRFRLDIGPLVLRNANLSNSNLYKANLSHINLDGADLSNSKLRDADLSNTNLNEANLSGADLDGADLSDAILSGSNLSNTNLTLANLSNVNLSSVNLNHTILTFANLSNADLRQVNTNKAYLNGVVLNNAKVSKKNWIKELEEQQNSGIEEVSKKWVVDTVLQREFPKGEYYLIKPKK